MADDTEDLQITITGDASAGEAAIQATADAVTQFIARLEAAMVAGGKMSDGLVAGAGKGKEALTGLSAGLKDVEEHSMLVSRGLSAIGLEADAGAIKVGALAGVLADVGKAAGPLLLLATALEVVTGGFRFLADGVKDAADLQSQMASLKAVVEAQGGSWDQARESIEKFVASESIAAGYTSGELVSALNTLVSAGNSVKDSETLLAVAAELARGKHIELREAVDALLQAEAGHDRQLIALDHNLKTVADSHGKLSDAVKILNHDFGDVINNTNTLEMASARLNVAQKQLGEDIGAVLLPMITNMDIAFMGALRNGEDLAKGLGDYFRGLTADIVGLAGSTEHFALMLADFAQHNYAGVATEWTATQHAWNDAMKGGSLALKGMNEAGTELFHGQDAWTRGMQEQTKAILAHTAAAKQKLDVDHAFTNKQPSPSGTPGTSFSYTPYDLSAGGANEPAEQNKDLLALIDTTKDLTEKQRELQAAVSDSAYAQQFYNTAVVSVTKQLDNAKTAANAYNAQISAQVAAGTAETTEQTNHAAVLADRVKQLQTALDNATKAQQANRDATAADTDALIANAKAIADLAAKHKDFTDKENDRVREELATWQMTNAQKVSYYQHVLDSLSTLDADYEAKYEAALKARDDAELEELKQRKQAYEDFIKTVQGFEDTFVGDIIEKHKSLGDAFKDTLDDMLASYKKWIAQMLVQNALAPLNKDLASMFGFGGGSANPLASGGSSGGPNGTSANPVYVNLSPSTLAALTGSQTGIAGTLTTGSDGLPVSLIGLLGGSSSTVSGANAAGGASAGTGVLAGLFGGGGAGGGGSILSVLGATMAGGSLGSSVGGGIGGALGGALGAGIGIDLAAGGTGAIGGMGGLMDMLGASGPWGWAALAAGGLLGSGVLSNLIGPHWGPATNYPDRSDTQNYGQFLANWQGGTPTVNGQKFTAASQYLTADGGTPEIDQMEQWAAGLNGSTTGLTPDQLAAYKSIEGLMGGNNNANLGIANEHNGMLTLGNGSTITVAQAEAMINNYTAGSGGSAVSPVFTVTHGLPDANQYTSTQTGVYTEQGTGTSYLNGGSTATAGGGAAAGGVTVVLQVSGDVVGVSKSDLVNSLAQAVMGAHRGVGTGSGIAPRRPVFQ